MKHHRGFTTLEVLISIAILVLAAGILMLSFSKLNSRQALDRSVDTVVSVLNQARSMTLASAGGDQYGVSFQDGQVVLFRGSSYSASSPTNATTTLNGLVGIRNITLTGGGTSVVFKRLTGATDQSGSVELYLRDASTTARTITITATGIQE